MSRASLVVFSLALILGLSVRVTNGQYGTVAGTLQSLIVYSDSSCIVPFTPYPINIAQPITMNGNCSDTTGKLSSTGYTQVNAVVIVSPNAPTQLSVDFYNTTGVDPSIIFNHGDNCPWTQYSRALPWGLALQDSDATHVASTCAAGVLQVTNGTKSFLVNIYGQYTYVAAGSTNTNSAPRSSALPFSYMIGLAFVSLLFLQHLTPVVHSHSLSIGITVIVCLCVALGVMVPPVSANAPVLPCYATYYDAVGGTGGNPWSDNVVFRDYTPCTFPTQVNVTFSNTDSRICGLNITYSSGVTTYHTGTGVGCSTGYLTWSLPIGSAQPIVKVYVEYVPTGKTYPAVTYIALTNARNLLYQAGIAKLANTVNVTWPIQDDDTIRYLGFFDGNIGAVMDALGSSWYYSTTGVS